MTPDEDFGVEKTPGLDYDEEVMNRIADDVIKKLKNSMINFRRKKGKFLLVNFIKENLKG